MRGDTVGTVYLLHFSSPIQHARHYVGWTASELADRLSAHAAGRGARVVAAARRAGIDFDCTRHWDDVDRGFERQLKRTKNVPRLCPTCNPPKQVQRCRICGEQGHNRRRCPQRPPGVFHMVTMRGGEMLVTFLKWELACAKQAKSMSASMSASVHVPTPRYWPIAGLGGARVARALQRKGLLELGLTNDGFPGAKLTSQGRDEAYRRLPAEEAQRGG